MRDVFHRYGDRLRREDLDGLEEFLTNQLAAELRLSPNGLVVRYPLWLINHVHLQLPGAKKLRLTVMGVAGRSDDSVVHLLSNNETVLLWLIEAMIERHPAFARAIRDHQLVVLSHDNTHHLRVEFHWDPSQLVLHESI